MNGILDNFLVGLALLTSGGYALLSLGPKSLRRRLLGALSRVTAGAPSFLGLRRIAERLAAASAAKSGGACGGCNSCGSEQGSAQNPPTGDGSAAEVRVPLAKVGRRT